MELEEIKKLSPEERIKKLKELEEQHKKELEEAKKLIQESVEEIKRDEIAKQIEIPEQEQVNIDELFVPEGEDLEQAVAKEPAPLVETKQYEMPGTVPEEVTNLYSRLTELREEFQQADYMNPQQQKELSQAEQRLKQIDANYTLTDAVREQVVLSEKVAKQMRQYLT